MLREELVTKIALAMSITGLLSIFLLEQFFQPTELEIREINENSIGKNVLVKGIVKWKREKQGAIVFGLSNGKEISCVLLKKEKDFLEILKIGEFIVVEGRVQKGLNEEQIIVQRISKWEN